MPKCDIELVEQHSTQRCRKFVTFGCGPNDTIWTTPQCQGLFRCRSVSPPRLFPCGYPLGKATNSSCRCDTDMPLDTDEYAWLSGRVPRLSMVSMVHAAAARNWQTPRNQRACKARHGFLRVQPALQAAHRWYTGGSDPILREVELAQARGRAGETNRLIKSRADFRPNASSFRLLGPIGPACDGGLRSYGKGDLEKRVCVASFTAASRSRRVLFSIGCNNEFGFESAAARDFDRIYVFDCTLPKNALNLIGTSATLSLDHSAAGSSSNLARLQAKMTFFPVCLGHPSASTPERRYANYSELLSLTGEMRGPDLLKMDIEGWEWSTLSAMATEAASPSWPRHLRPAQIAFEAHLADLIAEPYLVAHPGRTRAPGVPYCSKYRRQCGVPAAEVHAFMRILYSAGYLLADARPNAAWAHCIELLVVQPCLE